MHQSAIRVVGLLMLIAGGVLADRPNILFIVADEAIAFLHRNKEKTFALSVHFREPLRPICRCPSRIGPASRI